jgi:hypothetical protein
VARAWLSSVNLARVLARLLPEICCVKYFV